MSKLPSETNGAERAEVGTRPSWAFWVGLVVLLLATGYIVTSSMSNTVHYYDVDEVAGRAEMVGQNMRLRGHVVEGSHRVREGTLDEHLFLLGLEQRSVTVLFTGALPDQFQDGASVIATGRLTDRETFAAESITAQCPSRYEEGAPTASEGDGPEGQAPYGDEISPSAPRPYLHTPEAQPGEQP